MVERARPVISATAACPPRPAVRASAAANKRLPRSSSFEPKTSHRCLIASRDTMNNNYHNKHTLRIPRAESYRRRHLGKRFSYC